MPSSPSCPCSHPAVHISIANVERTQLAEVQSAITRLSTTISDNHQHAVDTLARLTTRLENPTASAAPVPFPPQLLPIPPLNAIRKYLRHLDHCEYTTDRILTHYQDNTSFEDYDVDRTTTSLELMEQKAVRLMLTVEARLNLSGYSHAADGLRRPRSLSLPTVLEYDASIPHPAVYGITRTTRI